MGFDLMSGLMAGANFGQGYMQGQQQAQDRAMQQQFQNLALQNNQLVYNQNLQNQQRQQAMSDFMMQNFQTQDTKQAAPPPPVDMSQVGKADPMQGQIADAYKMANFAKSTGDVSGYAQWTTQAANLQNAYAQAKDKQAGADLTESKRQAAHYSEMAQAAFSYDKGPLGLESWKQQVVQNPNSSPEEKQNVLRIRYTPDWQSVVSRGAMTAAQRAQDQVRQTELGLKERNVNSEIANREARFAEEKRKNNWEMNKPPGREKSGQDTKAVTSAQLSHDATIVAQTLYGDSAQAELTNRNNPLLNGPKAKEGKGEGGFSPDPNTYGMNVISNETNKLMQQIPGLSREEAVARATRMAEQSGLIHVTPATKEIPGRHFFDPSTPAKPSETKVTQLGSKTAPRPLTAEMLKSGNAMPGWYTTSKGVHYWTGSGWNDSKG